MSDLVGNPEDRFSYNEAHMIDSVDSTVRTNGITPMSTEQMKCLSDDYDR